MSILSSHAASWHSDKWYRRAWYIWPQAISLLLVGWLFAGAPIPWAQPKTQAPPAAKARPPAPQQQTSPQADSDEAICPQSNLANALNACSRLIDAGEGRFGPYFWRAQIYLRNEDYDHAIEDLSKFIQLNPKNRWALNDRGSAYEKKGELNKALADFQEAQNNGSTTASEDIKRIEGAIQSLRFKPLEAVPAGRRALRRHPGGRQALYAGRPRVGSSRTGRGTGTEAREVCCRWDQCRCPSITRV